ncbi:MAG: hypothetical protein K6E19_03820 [Lachnospiraceae bacterium]|nr:hypothetical protein [Lachnospiraceae bacterium]
MKKKVLTITVLLALALTGCGEKGAQGNSRVSTSISGVKDILDQQMAAADNGITEIPKASVSDPVTETSVEESPFSMYAPEMSEDLLVTNSPQTDVEVDLTLLSSTMVYTQVYDMVTEPEKYIGRKVRMEGLFSSLLDEATGIRYNACIIQDATACCAQGIEFELGQEYTYPDDYPEEGADITVVGEFDTYMEGELMYCTLRNATMEAVGE